MHEKGLMKMEQRELKIGKTYQLIDLKESREYRGYGKTPSVITESGLCCYNVQHHGNNPTKKEVRRIKAIHRPEMEAFKKAKNKEMTEWYENAFKSTAKAPYVALGPDDSFVLLGKGTLTYDHGPWDGIDSDEASYGIQHEHYVRLLVGDKDCLGREEDFEDYFLKEI